MSKLTVRELCILLNERNDVMWQGFCIQRVKPCDNAESKSRSSEYVYVSWNDPASIRMAMMQGNYRRADRDEDATTKIKVSSLYLYDCKDKYKTRSDPWQKRAIERILNAGVSMEEQPVELG